MFRPAAHNAQPGHYIFLPFFFAFFAMVISLDVVVTENRCRNSRSQEHSPEANYFLAFFFDFFAMVASDDVQVTDRVKLAA